MKIKGIEDKIPYITKLATNDALNAEINEIKYEISSNSGVATTSALTAVKDKIPDISDLVKRTDYDAKVSEMEKMFYYFWVW